LSGRRAPRRLRHRHARAGHQHARADGDRGRNAEVRRPEPTPAHAERVPSDDGPRWAARQRRAWRLAADVLALAELRADAARAHQRPTAVGERLPPDLLDGYESVAATRRRRA